MKKIIIVGFAIVVGLSSCTVQNSAMFTSVEKIIKLNLNSTLDETIKTLGSEPHNVYSSQLEGYSVYEYKYKLIERVVSPYKVNEIGGETTGTVVYNPKEHNLVLFFKDNKLMGYVTDEGKKNSSLIVLNNTLYMCSKERGQYVLKPSELGSKTNSSQGSLPSLKKIKK